MKRFIRTALIFVIVYCTLLTLSSPVSACTFSNVREIYGDETSGIKETDGIFTFELSIDGDSYCLTDCRETASGQVIIPSTYNGLPVTKLSASSFEGCERMTSVQIPETITEILCNTFYGCGALKNIDLPKTIQYIGYSAFDGCDSLESVTIDGNANDNADTFTQEINGTEYASYYFVRDDVLFLNTDVYIGNNLKVKPINHNSLIKYPSGKQDVTYTIPSDINEIWTNAFSSLRYLEEITVPSSVTNLYSQVFHGYGKEYEKPLTIIFGHSSFTGDLLTSYALYDLPDGSKIVVENEEIKEVVQSLDLSFSTLFDTDKKIAIEVYSSSSVEPLNIENIISSLLEIIMQLLKIQTEAFNTNN